MYESAASRDTSPHQEQPETDKASTVRGIDVPVPASMLPPSFKAHYVHTVLSIFLQNRKALLGLCMVFFFVLVGLLGPLFISTDPNALTGDVLVPPSTAHWFGTTQTGQDVFAQVVVGTRSSVFWGLATSLVATLLSVLVGLTAGYFGGIVDDLLSLLTNVFFLLPGFVLAVILAAYSPVRGPVIIAVLLAVTNWSYQARILRAQTFSIRKRDFVEAAQATGEATWRVLLHEILPNEIAIVAAGFIGTTLYVILAAAGLEFLGLGNVALVDWGTMFYWAQVNNALLQDAWWWFAPPGLCIALLGAGLALINFGIDEIADPRLRGDPGVAQQASRFAFFQRKKILRA